MAGDPRKGLGAFRDYADYGYCLSIGEWHRDVNSVAVPLLHQQYGVLAFNAAAAPVFSCHGKSSRMTSGPRLISMVQNIGTATR